jgi:hypothetical protein
MKLGIFLSAIAVILVGAICWAQEVNQVDANTPRDLQIRIARLAAPKEVSANASIYVLGGHGYELAESGNNGFTCLIEIEKPNTMEPECYDAEGSGTTLQVRIFVEKQRASGTSEAQIDRMVGDGYKQGKFKPPSKSGIVYIFGPN